MITRRGFLAAAGAAPLLAQPLVRRVWTARWIAAPKAPANEYGVYYFRRSFDLAAKPERFAVHVSGDNRYQLFVNGRRVSWGPARGDLFHWRYETVDLAPYMVAGRNVIAAVVWNFGELAPEAQITLQTGFVLQGDGEAERIADTGPSWRAWRDEAYSPITDFGIRAYYVVGPGDRVKAASHPWGWESAAFDDSHWPQAAVVGPAAGREARDVHSRWMLIPRPIPMMEERPEEAMSVRRVEGMAEWTGRVPVHAKAVVLFDQKRLTTGHPELTVSGGKDAVVRLRYAEALTPKGRRDEIDGKRMIGNYDEIVLDGGGHRVFRPL